MPPGIQEKIDHNILKLAGEVIVRKTMDKEDEPGGIQCIDALYEYLGINLPAHLEFPISIDQRVELEKKRNLNEELIKKVLYLNRALSEERESNDKMEFSLFKQNKNFQKKRNADKAY